jgi:hypothetical protein
MTPGSAGQIRTVSIAKESSSADIFRALHGENFLQGLERGPLLDRFTLLAAP